MAPKFALPEFFAVWPFQRTLNTVAPTYTLPDFFAGWPFQRTLNTHYGENLIAANAEWVESFGLLDDKTQAVLQGCKFPLFAGLVYPRADSTHLRLACDFMTWTFFVDELGDPSDGASFRKFTAGLMDILRDPSKPRPAGQSNFQKLTTSFWSRTLAYAHPTPVKRFVESMEPVLEAICQELEDRDHGHIRKIDKYLTLGRNTSGLAPCFHFLLLSKELPQEVINHPQIESLTLSALDMVVLSNDVYSWNFERSRGIDDHNMVSVVMAEKGLDIQGAIDYVGEWYHNLSRKFVEDMDGIPSFSEAVDPLVSEYISGLGNWVTGFLEWSFESERYFGSKGPEIKLTRVVELRPRSYASRRGPLAS